MTARFVLREGAACEDTKMFVNPSLADPPPRPTTTCAAKVLRILLAEDDPVNQRVAVGLLKRRGHEVTIANNGREAVDTLGRGSFDVVLMDVQMPEMDGFEATAVIRQRERQTGHHQYIVAMTAHAMRGDRERCLDAGMDAYVSKPVNPGLLYATVEHPPDALLALRSSSQHLPCGY